MTLNRGRGAGILLHLTSLPGDEGIGTLGRPATRFADQLAEMGQRWWQMLPIGPTGYQDSPYQSTSTFAGNPLLISLAELVDDGLLRPAEVAPAMAGPSERVDFGQVASVKPRLLDVAASRFLLAGGEPSYAVFRKAPWLAEYALYAALKAERGGSSWADWGPELATRREPDLQRASRRLAAKIERQITIQYFFEKQWSQLTAHCHRLGIGLIGDLPIYLAYDSADVWSHRDLVRLDAGLRPLAVGGVPADYYNPEGQLWGNPLYRWDAMAEDRFSWWAGRLRHVCSRFDLVRLDHFRGFEAFWEVPADAANAIRGRWVPGPGIDFFAAMEASLGTLPLVAEDLGFMTEEVHSLRTRLGLPGMRVAQFGFGAAPGDRLHHPAAYPSDVVAYTATHDSDTTQGWFWEGNPGHDRRRLRGGARRMARQLGINGSEVHWDMATLVWESAASMSITPAQDVLGLGSQGRMNVPGQAEGNWRWRMQDGIPDEAAIRLHDLTKESGRAP